jgi:hypothetical protein
MGSTLFVGRVRVDHLLGFCFVGFLCVLFVFVLVPNVACASGLSFALALRLSLTLMYGQQLT